VHPRTRGQDSTAAADLPTPLQGTGESLPVAIAAFAAGVGDGGDGGGSATMMQDAEFGGGLGEGVWEGTERVGAWGGIENVSLKGEIVHDTLVRAHARAKRRAARSPTNSNTRSCDQELTVSNGYGSLKNAELQKLMQQQIQLSQDLLNHSHELGKCLQTLVQETTVLRQENVVLLYSLHEVSLSYTQTQTHSDTHTRTHTHTHTHTHTRRASIAEVEKSWIRVQGLGTYKFSF